MIRLAIVACVALGGCTVVGPPPPQTISAAFNPSEVAWFQAAGSNTIRGSALLRTVGGEVRTCAGLAAYLVPVSAYARERFSMMYGEGDHGFLPAQSGFRFSSTNPEYERMTRTATCDAQGNFSFTALPDGEYFVTALVTWGIPMQYFTRTEGGFLMQRLRVAGGETREVVLTAN